MRCAAWAELPMMCAYFKVRTGPGRGEPTATSGVGGPPAGNRTHAVGGRRPAGRPPREGDAVKDAPDEQRVAGAAAFGGACGDGGMAGAMVDAWSEAASVGAAWSTMEDGAGQGKSVGRKAAF